MLGLDPAIHDSRQTPQPAAKDASCRHRPGERRPPGQNESPRRSHEATRGQRGVHHLRLRPWRICRDRQRRSAARGARLFRHLLRREDAEREFPLVALRHQRGRPGQGEGRQERHPRGPSQRCQLPRCRAHAAHHQVGTGGAVQQPLPYRHQRHGPMPHGLCSHLHRPGALPSQGPQARHGQQHHLLSLRDDLGCSHQRRF